MLCHTFNTNYFKVWMILIICNFSVITFIPFKFIDPKFSINLTVERKPPYLIFWFFMISTIY